MQFEWDPPKAAATLKRHRVSFYEAATVLADPLTTFPDEMHSQDEARVLTIGASTRSNILVVRTRSETILSAS